MTHKEANEKLYVSIRDAMRNAEKDGLPIDNVRSTLLFIAWVASVVGSNLPSIKAIATGARD